MWLVYLRFDDEGQVVTTHVRTSNKSRVQDIIGRAKRHGFTSTARLVDYMAFYSSGTIKRPQPSSGFLEHGEFLSMWEQVGNTG
jgi:hypothetical protein